MARVIDTYDSHTAWATMSARSFATILFHGLFVGIITYILYILLQQFIFEPVLCREGAALARCDSTQSVSAGTAIILGSFLGLILLVRERVYRSIMAVIGIVVSLWGIFGLVASMPFLLAAVIVTLLFATAYVLFSWLVQPTSLAVSIAGVIIVMILARLALS